MIESVAARQQGAFNFEDHYDNLCALQDCAPLPAVKSHLAQGVIDLNGDRVRLNDWNPIINSIRINKSLQFIGVRSFYQMPVLEGDDTLTEKRNAILRRRIPAIRSKEITHRFMKGLKECLFVSPCLSCIELQGLSLRDRDLHMLVKGILKSPTLRHLSLEYCRIGDQGLEVLCTGLKNSKHINSVNLSGCCLSYRGAESLAAVIKHQGMQRHNEAWRDSLRYRRPDLDRMSGLRRITANSNPMLGDDGAAAFAEALKDDLWFKALDLQACGIGAEGATSFLEVLKYNTTLVVLDLRKNPLIERGLMHSVMEQLMLNTNGEEGEQYKWMTESLHQEKQSTAHKPLTAAARVRRRATKVLNSSLGKKTTIKVTPTANRRRSRPLASRRVDVAPSPGLPWRTAARANRFRGHPPDAARYQNMADKSSDLSASILYTSAQSHLSDDEDNSTADVLIKVDTLTGTGSGGDVVGRGFGSPMYDASLRTKSSEEDVMKKIEESHLALDYTNQKDIQIELEQMRRHVREERLARAKSDQKVVQMMIENRKLAEEVNRLQREQNSTRLAEEVNRLKREQNSTRLAEDESFLETVEASFKQFHAFIDMLRDAGLGQLVTMAGLDQSTMPFSANNDKSNENILEYDNKTYSGGHHHPRNDYRNNSNSNNNDSSSNGFISNGYKSSNSNNGVDFVTGAVHDAIYANVPVKGKSMTGNLGDEGESHEGKGLDSTYANVPRSRVFGDESDTARQEADDVYTRLMQETRGALGQGASATTAMAPSSVAPGAASMPTGVSITKALAQGDRPSRRIVEAATSHEGRGQIDADTDDGNEPSSSQGHSGRGQDDRRGGQLHGMSAEDLDSADEDF